MKYLGILAIISVITCTILSCDTDKLINSILILTSLIVMSFSIAVIIN